MIIFLIIHQALSTTYGLYDQQDKLTYCLDQEWFFQLNPQTSPINNHCIIDSCGTLGSFLGQLNMDSKLYKTYYDLDQHTKIKIKVTFVKIDDYVYDYLQIDAGTTFDTKQAYKILLQEGGAISSQNSQLVLENISAPSVACHSTSGSGSSKTFDVVLEIDHTDNTLFVQFSTDYIATTRAWGIRNYELYLQIDCIVNCNKCTSQTYCTQCAANRITTPNCLCPLGYYDSGVPQCQKCLSSCSTCSNGISCTSCPAGRNGPYCLCNSGTYDQNGTCASCSYQCSTCNNSDTECTSCALNRINIPTCLCAQGYYQSNIQCLQCSYKCGTCDNPNSCLACSNIKRTLPNCLCPSYEVQGQSTCSQCSQFCDQCNTAGCTTCKEGYYLINNECQKCSYKCATCNTKGCLTCSDESRKIQNQCTCQSYEIQNQAICPICSSLCQSCDQNGCLSCLGSNRQAPSCGCLPNYYLNQSECQPCPQGCSSCNANGCQSCYDNIHVLPKCDCPEGSTDVRGKCILTSNIFNNIFAQFSDDLLSVIIYFSGVQNISTSLGPTDQIPSVSNCNILNAISGKCYILDLTFIINLPDFHQYNTKTIMNIVDGGIIINGKKNLVFPNIIIQAKQIYPQFNLQYQQTILSCKSYQFSVNNIINVGNTFYQTNIKSSPSIQGLDQNFIINQLNESNYTITVSLTNFLGFTNSTNILVQVINQQLPFIKIEPLLNDIYAYQEIHINAEVGIESCQTTNNISSIISTKWIVDGVSQSNFGSFSYLTKVFQEYYFKPNTQHKISLVAQLGELIQQSDIILNIKTSPILIQTVGGSRVVSTYDDINLEASINDLDKVGYNLTWTCVETLTQKACPILFNNSNQQYIPRGVLNSYISYIITIKANNYVSSIQLLLKDIGTNQLLVQYPSRYTSQPVNINENLIFIAQLEQNVLKQNINPSQTIKYNIMQNGSIIFSQTQTSSVISFQLQQFPIQATVVQFKYQDQISYLTLVPNQGPDSGYFKIDQLGYGMNTLINMELLDFKDSNTPLQYKFSFINNDELIILNEWSYSNKLVTKLPQGRFKNNYNITVIGEVSDSLGAITKLYKNVTIKPLNNRLLQSGQQLVQLIQQSIDNGDDLSLYSYQYSNMQADGCLKNCSNNGVCDNNQCQCKTGYYLDDCSVVEQDYDDIIKAMNKIISQLQILQTKDMSQSKSQQLADSIRMSLSRLEIQQSLNQQQISTASQQAQNQLLNLLNDQSIQKANTKNLITDPPDPAKLRRIQQINNNTQSQTLVMDQLYTSTAKYNSTQFKELSQQDNLNKQMTKQSRNVTSFFANQLFVDQDPQIINGTNFQINAQRLSNQQSIKYLPSSSFIFYNLDEDEMEILYQQGLGDEIEVSTIQFNTNPHVADTSFPYQNQSNQFILPNIINKEGIPSKPKQKLAYTLKVKSNKNNVCITQKDNKWTTDGCAQLNTLLLGESTCSCNSITEVTIVDDIANMFENSNLSALWNPGALINFKFWESGLFYTSTGLFVAWCICIAIGHKKDKVDYQHFLSHKRDEKQVQVEVDYDTDEEERKKKEILKKNRRIAKEFIYGFPMLHNFVSIFTVFSDEQPRPARFTVYFLKMTVMMTLTSIFGARLTITQNVVFAVLCVGLMTPITMFLINGFAHDAKKQKKIMCVIMIIMIYAGCYYVCLTVAAKMGVDQSNQWLLTYLLSLLLDVLIMETITIFLKLLIVPYIKAHIHSGNFIIRILYLYMFDEQIDIVLNKVN